MAERFLCDFSTLEKVIICGKLKYKKIRQLTCSFFLCLDNGGYLVWHGFEEVVASIYLFQDCSELGCFLGLAAVNLVKILVCPIHQITDDIIFRLRINSCLLLTISHLFLHFKFPTYQWCFKMLIFVKIMGIFIKLQMFLFFYLFIFSPPFSKP